MPSGSRLNGESGDSVEMAFSGLPLTETKVPRRV